MGLEKSDIKTAFGMVLSEIRTEKKISHVELEDRSGVTRKHLYNLEKGIHDPTLSILFKLANALDTRPDHMITGVIERLDASGD